MLVRVSPGWTVYVPVQADDEELLTTVVTDAVVLATEATAVGDGVACGGGVGVETGFGAHPCAWT